MMRELNLIDRVLIQADRAVRTLASGQAATAPNPTGPIEDTELPAPEREQTIRLLRVDHTGEVCAQALYQGQALTAKSAPVQERLDQAAEEELDHLAWCQGRLQELGGKTSLLNPAFYAGSFAIGALAGLLGDRWNLGFLAETEDQVSRHLETHLQQIPPQDRRSRAVLERMRSDEQQHADTARAYGGADLPTPVRRLMRLASKVMTKTTYWV